MSAKVAQVALAMRYHLDNDPEWKSLLNHLEFADGMALIILLVPDSYGARTCREKLKRHFASRGEKLQVVRIGLRDAAGTLVASMAKPPRETVAAFWIETAKAKGVAERLLGLEPF